MIHPKTWNKSWYKVITIATWKQVLRLIHFMTKSCRSLLTTPRPCCLVVKLYYVLIVCFSWLPILCWIYSCIYPLLVNPLQYQAFLVFRYKSWRWKTNWRKIILINWQSWTWKQMYYSSLKRCLTCHFQIADVIGSTLAQRQSDVETSLWRWANAGPILAIWVI